MLHCNRNRRSSCALAVAFAATVTLTAFVPAAHAGFGGVGFENLVIDRLDLAGPQSEGGFTYEAVTGAGWELVSAFGNPPSSLATVFNDEDSNVGDTVEIHAGGKLFTFDSVDYRALAAGIPDVVQISGFRDGAFIDVLPLDTPSTSAFQTIASGFTEQIDLLRVRVTSDGTSALLLDNFALTLAPAPGVAITFENLVIDRLDLAGPKFEGPFTYQAVSGQGWELVSQFGNPPSSLATVFNDENTPVGGYFEIHADGRLFTFASVDYRSLLGGVPDQVTLTAYRNGGFVDSMILNNPSTTAFQTVASTFTDEIDRLRVVVTFDGSAALFLDNFALALVPTGLPYDNNAGGAAGIDGAILSDLDNSSVNIFRIDADDVTLGLAAAVTSIEWTGLYAGDNTPPAIDDFTIAIYADTGTGAPDGGAPLHTFHVGNAVNRTATGSDIFGFDVFNYTASINFVLPANTTVWVSIYGNTVGENDDFYWGMDVDLGNSFNSPDDGDSWTPSGHRQDFRLFGDAVICPADIVTSKTFAPPPDGIVDGADLAFLLGEWGANPGSMADIVTRRTFAPPPDGKVDGADLAVLLGAWGTCE